MTKSDERQWAICLRNDGYPASLEIRKLYEVIPDPVAASHQCLRVVDESGEDYLFPDEYFILVELPANVEEALHTAA